MKVEVANTPVVEMLVPEWFQDDGFLAWLNDPTVNVMTWHKKGAPASEWSDVIVFVDPSLSGEGDCQLDMPEAFWDQIIAGCKQVTTPSTGNHIMVVLKNITD